MNDFTESEVFDHIEQFLFENNTEELSKMSGLGRHTDLNTFKKLRQFINHLNDKYHTGLGVVDGNYGLRQFSPKKVEDIFYDATGSRMTYGDIVKNLKELVFFLNEMKMENIHIFDDLHKKASKFIKFMKKLRNTEIGKRYTTLMDEIEEKFEPFYDSLEFYIQQSIGFDYKKKDLKDMSDFNEDLNDLSDYLREFQTLLKRIKVVKKQGFPHLVQKYIEGLSNKNINHKQWNNLVRLISQFPLHLRSDILTPEEIRNFLVDTANFVMLNNKDDEKEEFIQKIKILFQKVIDKKMDGGSNNRVYNDEINKAYKKKMIIEIFRYNLQGYYSDIVSRFNDLIKQKYIGQLNIISSSLRQTTNDLKQIFTLLIDDTYIENDLKDFINIIKSEDEYTRDDKFKEGLRIKFQYIKQEVDNIIKDAKESEYAKNVNFTEDFLSHIRAISSTIGNLISYLKTLEKKDFDITDQELKSFQHEMQRVNTQAISDELQTMMENITTFINVSHMYQNIERTKKELDTIDLKKYQDQTVKLFIDSKNDMQKYYKELYEFFKKEETVYNPTLALYMKEVLLKFHSCLYISKGISCHPIVNPRYFVNPYLPNATNLKFQAFDDVQNGMNKTTPYFIEPIITEVNRLQLVQFVGITEELGARTFKGQSRYKPDAIIFPNQIASDFLPKLPTTLSDIETTLEEHKCPPTTKYNALRKYYDIFDIIPTKPIKMTFGQMRPAIPVVPNAERATKGQVDAIIPAETYQEYLTRIGALIYDADENEAAFATRVQLMGFRKLNAESDTNYIARGRAIFNAGNNTANKLQSANYLLAYSVQDHNTPSANFTGASLYKWPDETDDELIRRAKLIYQVLNRDNGGGGQLPYKLATAGGDTQQRTSNRIQEMYPYPPVGSFLVKHQNKTYATCGIGGGNLQEIDYQSYYLKYQFMQGPAANENLDQFVTRIMTLIPAYNTNGLDSYTKMTQFLQNPGDDKGEGNNFTLDRNIPCIPPKMAYVQEGGDGPQHALRLQFQGMLNLPRSGYYQVGNNVLIPAQAAANIGAQTAAVGTCIGNYDANPNDPTTVSDQAEKLKSIFNFPEYTASPNPIDINIATAKLASNKKYIEMIKKIYQARGVQTDDDYKEVIKKYVLDNSDKFINRSVQLTQNIVNFINSPIQNTPSINLYFSGQISRLLQTKFGVIKNKITSNSEQFRYIQHIITSLQNKKGIPDNPPQIDTQYPVLCLNNQNLKEHLLPEIQVPFIQPLMKLFSIEGQNYINGADAAGNILQTFKEGRVTRLQVGALYSDLARQLQSTQYDTITLDTNYFKDVTNNNLQQFQPTNSWDRSILPITSMFGAQLSIPLVHTPTGIFGQRITEYSNNTLNRFIKLKQITESRPFGLFDRCNMLRVFNHGQSITQLLDDQNSLIPEYLVHKANIIFHPINADIQCINPRQDCASLICPVSNDSMNSLVEYQMYVSQQLQYFALQGTMAIFDPVVRKSLFNLINIVYQGHDILPGLGSKLRIIQGFAYNAANDETLLGANNANIDTANLYYILARPFGQGSIQRDQTQLQNQNDVKAHVSQYPLYFYQTRQGKYKQIPENFVNNQPRVGIPVILKKCKNNTYRDKLIDLCSKKCPTLIENGVLKATKETIDVLLEILDGDVDGEKMRAYLSRCVQIQYHNNYTYMCQQEQIRDTVQLHSKVELEQGKLRFLDLVKKVINIKQVGNAALILLTDMVNNSINEQINQIKETKKIDYKSLLDELNNLIIIYREQTDPIDYFDGFLTKNELKILTRNSHYLNNYRNIAKKGTQFFDNKYEMVGGAGPQNNPFDEYFTVLEKYVNGIKDVVHKMPIVQNFAQLFSVIANHEGNSKSLNSETIKRFISEYLISSMIDINEAVFDFNFNVDLQPITIRGVKNPDHFPLNQTQLVVDVREGKSLNLITPECIFVPIIMKPTNPLAKIDQQLGVQATDPTYVPYDVNAIQSNVQLVPQFTSRITRDFDQLFNQLINAMSQRMLNHIGLYRFTQKKQLDETVQISRIMLGVGKKNKYRSQRQQIEDDQDTSDTKLSIVDNRTEMTQSRFELYFRIYLLVKYYYKLFDQMNAEIKQRYGDSVQYLLYQFAPDSTEPEGKLFQILDFLKPDSTTMFDPIATPNPPSNKKRQGRTIMQMEDLLEFMRQVDKIGRKHGLIQNDQYYAKITQFVNLSFGVISNVDQKKLETMEELAQQQPLTLKTFINGYNTPIQPVQVGDARLSSLTSIMKTEKEERDLMYTNMKFIIEKTINKISDVLNEFAKERDRKNENLQSIHKYIRNQYKLLKLKNADISEFNNNLLYIINNIGQNQINDIQIPLMFHEQFLFAVEIYNRVKMAQEIKNEFDNIDDHQMLGYVPPPDPNGSYNNNIQKGFVLPAPSVNGDQYIGQIGSHQEFLEVYEGKNKQTIINFINKLSDQYSLFAGSNLIHFNFNNEPLTVDPAKFTSIPANIQGDVARAGGGADDNLHRVYMQSYQQFKKKVIIEDDTVLSKKLKQLKSIIESLHSNSRFDLNRQQMYGSQYQLLSKIPLTATEQTTVNNEPDDTSKLKKKIEIQNKKSILSANRRHPLVQMIGAGRVNITDDDNIDDAMNNLTQFDDGDIPMQDNIYYKYGVNQVQQKTIAPIEISETSSQRSAIMEESKIQEVQQPTQNQDLSDALYRIFSQQLGTGDLVYLDQNINYNILKYRSIEPANVKINMNNLDDFMLITTQPVGSEREDQILTDQQILPNSTVIKQNKEYKGTERQTKCDEFVKYSRTIMQDQENPGQLIAVAASDIREQIQQLQSPGAQRIGGQNTIKMIYMVIPTDVLSILKGLGSRSEGQSSYARQEVFERGSQGSQESQGFGFGNGRKRGKGLGIDQLLKKPEYLQDGIEFDVNQKLKLERPFFFNYNIYEAQHQQNDEVFVFNRILKDFFISCKQLTGHLDLLGKMFNDQLNEHRGIMNLYFQIHGREVSVQQLKEKASLTTLSKLDRQFGDFSEAYSTESIVQNAIKYNDMVENVLYDGYHDLKDQFSCMDIEIHNRKHLESSDKLINLSVFTSSIYNFFGSWNKHLEVTKQVPLDLMSQLNMKFNNEDLQILVANAVFTKFKLQILLDKINFKQKLLDHVAQQIFINNTQQKWNIDSKEMHIRQYLIAQGQFLLKIKNTIQHKIIFALDIVINNKHSVLPQILQQGSIGDINQPLISNLFFLIDTKKTLIQLEQGNLKDDDDVFKLNFARYLYTVMNKHGSESIIKQLSSGNQYDVLLKFHDLITFLAKQRFALHNTILNTESYYAKAILLIANPELLKFNPEQIRNVKLPNDLYIFQDGAQLIPIETSRIQRDIQDLVREFAELENDWVQANARVVAGPDYRRLARFAEEAWKQCHAKEKQIINLCKTIHKYLTAMNDPAADTAQDAIDAYEAIDRRSTQNNPANRVNGIVNIPYGNTVVAADRNWIDPADAVFTDVIDIQQAGVNDGLLNDGSKKYLSYLHLNKEIIRKIGTQIYGYQLQPLDQTLVKKNRLDMYMQYRHFFTKPQSVSVAFVEPNLTRYQNKINPANNELLIYPIVANNELDTTLAEQDDDAGFIQNYNEKANDIEAVTEEPIQYFIRDLNRTAIGFQVLPYVYCRRESHPTQRIELHNDNRGPYGDGVGGNKIYNVLTNWGRYWIYNPEGAPKCRYTFQLYDIAANGNFQKCVANCTDIQSLQMGVRVSHRQSVLYQANPINQYQQIRHTIDGVDRTAIMSPYYKPFSLQYTLPTINRSIFEEIIKYLTDQGEDKEIEMRNLVELGIVPLNMQMLKRDSGLINISIYASAFQEYMNKKFNQTDISNLSTKKLPFGTPLFNLLSMDMGIQDATLQKYVPNNPRGAPIAQWPAQMTILEHIIKNTQVFPDEVNRTDEMFPVTMKFDAMRRSLQFRVALFLYLILTEMIGGSVKRDRDIELKGIEALISGQFMNTASNADDRKY